MDEEKGKELFGVTRGGKGGMRPKYCLQNRGNCETCALVNYGKNCMNIPLEAHKVNGTKRISKDAVGKMIKKI